MSGSLIRKVKQGLKTQDVDNKHYLSWTGFEFAISEFVKDYKKNNYKCIGVYGPTRGGLPIAVTLSHRLDIPYFKGSYHHISSHLQVSNPDTFGIKGKILVVDDIADTGKTLEPLIRPNVITYTIYYHPQSTVKPDYYVFEKKDDWVVFPWEEDIYGYETNN
tara:strand:- start:539 stop:1024 length:486 start_codon:yes stop_codon:yes gene_type:complete